MCKTEYGKNLSPQEVNQIQQTQYLKCESFTSDEEFISTEGLLIKNSLGWL